jgi:DNA-directed RNA polymerase subunit beta'
VETLTPIRLRYTGEVIDLTTAYDDQDIMHTEPISSSAVHQHHRGPRHPERSLPEEMPFINGLLKKKGIGQLVNYCYLRSASRHGQDARRSQEARLPYATRAGISIGIDDMVIPDRRRRW